MGQTWLVTGGSGQVGSALRELAPAASVQICAPDRSELDLAQPGDVDELLRRTNAELIVNCGAYTAVDAAEGEEDLARRINADAPGVLAQAAASAGIGMVHISTDYVFDGELTGRAYREEDDVGPTGAYGRTKLAGEQAVLASACRSVILRTAWVVSPFGKNFVKTMLRLAEERDELRVVADQFGNPTSAHDIARAILTVGKRLAGDADSPTGVYHFTNSGSTSWHGLARHVVDRATRSTGRTVTVEPIATSDYPTPAKRPANSRLDTGKFARDFGFSPTPWEEAVDDIVDRLTAD
ncbi:dTDP-4-dehydrorhamnose reductase [Erythrobacter sp. 3-20A1M]|nr:dTDP-4-dehydrorhamnose reductase [Erythrobacter sp. 3-20A1M]